jgi:hypothetical protein
VTDQNDMHRTGCGCVECGPIRSDPMEGDLVDPELVRARQKLARIGELVERCFSTDPYNTTATLRAIREELAR